MRRLVALVLVLGGGVAAAQESTAVVRQGIYTDSDRTQVLRSLVAVDAALGRWRLSARESIDIVTSASIDVRTSPALDAVSSASGVSMSDRRFETTVGGAYDDGKGHTLGLSAFHATERDYQSVGAALSGSVDVAERNTTLFASGSYAHDSVSSIIDATFSRTLGEVSYGVGIAQVLAPGDALRLRYDGAYMNGYQASPYRNVRFGNWTTTTMRSGGRGGESTIVFMNTIGSADGLPELEPETRIRHALVLEWTHGFSDEVGLLASARAGTDSWGVQSATLGAELRLTQSSWQLRAGYRFYVQGAADFFLDRYTSASTAYTYYTSDKELGQEQGHIGSLDLAYIVRDWPGNGDRTLLDARAEVLYYSYPGFPLIGSRTSGFLEAGIRVEF
jgi:hypothetical protein